MPANRNRRERTPPRRGRSSFVAEGFPGTTIRECLKLNPTGYKGQGDDRREHRKTILATIQQLLPIENEVGQLAVDDPEGDALDALVLLIAAWVSSSTLEADWHQQRDELTASGLGMEGWFPV